MTLHSDLLVVIAVLTYKRPEDLLVALPRLLEQAELCTLDCSVLVVDNDPEASARATVESFAAGNLHYAHEPRPGIAAARNCALAQSAGKDLLIFIDDDEVPVGEWVNLLLGQYLKDPTTAVAGPVISEYEEEPSDWIEAGEFFNRPRMASGTPIFVAATNNLLLDLHQVRALALTFDDRYGISGGSDTLFTRQLIQRGGRMQWCDEAVVIDRVPRQRLTQEWVLRRFMRFGNSWSRVDLELAKSPWQRLARRGVLTVRGGIRLAGGLGRFSFGLASGSMRHRAKGLRTTARGIGMLSGAFGYIYSEYRRKTQ